MSFGVEKDHEYLSLRKRFMLSFAEDRNVFLFFPHLHVGRRPDVIDLEDHLDELGGELDLGLLAVEGLDDALLLHVAGAHLHAVHTEGRVALRHLPDKNC